MSIRTVTVFGASGRQGQAQVRALSKQGILARAITRHAGIFDRSEFSNVTVVPADYDDPSSLDRACEGTDAIFYQSAQFGSRGDIARQSENVADAARRAGVKRFVLNSTMWCPDTPCGQPLYDSVLDIENRIAARNIPLVVFRPVLFMDNLLAGWSKPAIVLKARYIYPQRPGLRMNPICLDDVAGFMIEALRRSELIGERITIGGPETLTPEDIAEAISAAVGRRVTYEYISPHDFADSFYELTASALNLPREAFIEFFESFYTFNNESPHQPFQCDMKAVLARIPVRMTPLKDWASQQDWSLDGEKVGSVSA